MRTTRHIKTTRSAWAAPYPSPLPVPAQKPDNEIQVTYPVTMPLSVFRKAEMIAQHDGITLGDYLVRGALSDFGSFEFPVTNG
jgi:hypothetical protein